MLHTQDDTVITGQPNEIGDVGTIRTSLIRQDAPDGLGPARVSIAVNSPEANVSLSLAQVRQYAALLLNLADQGEVSR